jgi:hypothetical protein
MESVAFEGDMHLDLPCEGKPYFSCPAEKSVLGWGILREELRCAAAQGKGSLCQEDQQANAA